MFNNTYKSVSEHQKQAVKNWWQALQNDQATIRESFSGTYQGNFNLPEWMQQNLRAIHETLMWEFGPGIVKQHRLVITPESRKELRPLVRYILQEAPEFEFFEFYEYRLAEDFEQASRMLAHRTNWQDISEIRFKTSINDRNAIDITFYTPFDEEKNEQFNKLWILSEQFLGEEILDKWLGYFDVHKLAKKSFFRFGKKTDEQSLPIQELKTDFEKRIQEVKNSLPAKPYREIIDDHGWVLVKGEPKKQDDYAHKNDLFVAPFISSPLFNAMHDGRNTFSAERFSKNGETFIFLKMDGSADDLKQEIFEDRATIEDKLTEVLKDKGGVIGGGTGYRYSYIDLAVSNLDEAIPIIQKTLQKGKLSKQSWLFLHDPYYQLEWIGVWPDSPEPFLS